MAEEEVLYSEDGRIGSESDDYIHDYTVDLYLKVGLFCGWSWQEFCQTPLPVIHTLSREIDFRIRNSENVLLNWTGQAVLQAISMILNSIFNKNR